MRTKGENTREKCYINQANLFQELEQQKLIREDEMALLLGLSKAEVSKAAKRLEQAKVLLRTRVSSGVWLRPKLRYHQSGLPELPITWRHDCLAIQVVSKMANEFFLQGQTEKQIRNRIIRGKIPDGVLIDDNKEPRYRIETEWSRKSGNHQAKMITHAFEAAKLGIYTIFAFPAPMRNCNHHLRLREAIKRAINKGENPISVNFFMFVRCNFQTLEQLDRARPFTIEVVDFETGEQCLPDKFD